MDEFDFLFKIVLIGDSGVGKTSLISQFIELELDDSKRSLIKNKQKEREKKIRSIFNNFRWNPFEA